MKINKVELVHTNIWFAADGSPLLHLTYHIMYSDGAVDELDIPGIAIPTSHIPDMEVSMEPLSDRATIDFGTLLLTSPNGYAWKQERIKFPVKKMTVAEIEKKLGHRVEIISEEDTDDK